MPRTLTYTCSVINLATNGSSFSEVPDLHAREARHVGTHVDSMVELVEAMEQEATTILAQSVVAQGHVL